MKYTKGPWTIIDGWDENGKGKYFPSVLLHGTEAEHRETLGRNSLTVNVSHDQEVESIMANAKLIAASPDLLEACIKALDECCDLIGTEAGKALEKAIEKATK